MARRNTSYQTPIEEMTSAKLSNSNGERATGDVTAELDS